MAVLHVLSAILGVTLLLSFAIYRRVVSKPLRRHTALVLVLGDIGRSPRMMYHAHSFARHEYPTTLVGYTDTPPIPTLLESPHIKISGIANPPLPLLRLPWVARAPIRIIWQILSVLKICLWDAEWYAEFMVVQNPPSIPTLALAQLIGWISGTKIVIDWHNTGYSILAMRTGEDHPLCRIARMFEATFGKHAFAHLFVTKALQDLLVNEWDLQGKHVVLHDRPPSHFRRTGLIERHDLFRRLVPLISPSISLSFTPASSDETPFTTLSHGEPALSPSRPAFLVSSTSWTADEDFTPLLTALDRYHLAQQSDTQLPRLFMLITGRGALRSAFEAQIAKRETEWKDSICVRCIFLPAADYPTLLGCADLGVSMHSSSSGRDLPMKVVDMFGCGTPVLALGFEAIGELVKDGQNGRVWHTGEELGKQLVDLLTGFPENDKLKRLKSYFESNSATSPGAHGKLRGAVPGEEAEWSNWDDNWDRVIYKAILTK